MIKINEKLDISKQVLTIDIQSPVFASMLSDLNGEIQRGIEKVFNNDFACCEISLKLNLEIPKAFKTIPKENEFGELVNETYTYRQPDFEHKITCTLKKQYKQEGVFTGEREVIFVDGEFVASPLKQEQMSIEDYE